MSKELIRAAAEGAEGNEEKVCDNESFKITGIRDNGCRL